MAYRHFPNPLTNAVNRHCPGSQKSELSETTASSDHNSRSAHNGKTRNGAPTINLLRLACSTMA
eukprot:3841733-Lingulodinium_polyedra.AAC.1